MELQAAAHGLMAGINLARKLQEKDAVVLNYIFHKEASQKLAEIRSKNFGKLRFIYIDKIAMVIDNKTDLVIIQGGEYICILKEM